MEPITAATIGATLIKALKTVGKWAWNYAQKTLQSFWDNKWLLIVAGFSSGIFLYYYNMLYNWFAFPPLLNIGVLGVFALINLSWVATSWKSAPSGGGGGESPKVSTGS